MDSGGEVTEGSGAGDTEDSEVGVTEDSGVELPRNYPSTYPVGEADLRDSVVPTSRPHPSTNDSPSRHACPYTTFHVDQDQNREPDLQEEDGAETGEGPL